MVKNIFTVACFPFSYFKLKRGMIPSKIQKNEIPATKIRLLWRLDMVSK